MYKFNIQNRQAASQATRNYEIPTADTHPVQRPQVRQEEDRHAINFLLSNDEEPLPKRQRLTENGAWAFLNLDANTSSQMTNREPIIAPRSPSAITTSRVIPIQTTRENKTFKTKNDLLNQLQEWGDDAADNLINHMKTMALDFRTYDSEVRDQMGSKVAEQPTKDILNLLSQFRYLADRNLLPSSLDNWKNKIVRQGSKVMYALRGRMMRAESNKDLDKSNDIVAATAGVILSSRPKLYNLLKELKQLTKLGLQKGDKRNVIERALKGESISEEDIRKVCGVLNKRPQKIQTTSSATDASDQNGETEVRAVLSTDTVPSVDPTRHQTN